MKHTKHLLVLWAALLLGAGNAWGYTVTFNTATTDGGSTSTNVSDYVDNTSQTYIASITTSKAYYNGKSGVKLGSSSAVGNIVLTLSATGQIKASEISIVSTAYSTDSKKYKCTVTYTDNNTVSQDLTAGEEVTISLDPAKTVSSVKFESVTKSKGRCYIGSFTITPAGTPPTTVYLGLFLAALSLCVLVCVGLNASTLLFIISLCQRSIFEVFTSQKLCLFYFLFISFA